MHLFTRSARFSRSSRGLPFSVRIQHSRAARACVIGSASAPGSAGLAACVLGASGFAGSAVGLAETTAAFGASAAAGPLPSVSQAASVVVAAARTAARNNARRIRVPEANTMDAVQVGDLKNAVSRFARATAPRQRAICPILPRLGNNRDEALHNRVLAREPSPVRQR